MIPQELTLTAIQAAFREIERKIRPLETGNMDLAGRRVINAGQSISPFDYVTQMELESAVSALPSTKDTATTSGALASVSSVRVAAYATQGSAAAHSQELFIASDRNYTPYVSDGATWTQLQGDEIDDAVTNAATILRNLVHRSSGAPLANFGASLRYQLDSSTNVLRTAGLLDVIWATPTNGAEDSDFVLKLVAGGAAIAEKFRLTSAGHLKAVGKITLYNNAAPTDGKLLIGNTGTATFDAATLTAGTGVNVTNGGGTITIAATHATYANSPADPTGTTSTTGVMMGLAGSITPVESGAVLLHIAGVISNSTLAAGSAVQLRYGTGSAPTNGAALTGSTAGVYKNMTAAMAADRDLFSLCFVVTGLTLSTAYWIDVGLKAITAGTATLADLDVVAVEL